MNRPILGILLGITLVGLLSCGGSSMPTESKGAPVSGGNMMTVSVVDNAFNPQTINVQPGDTVQWVMNGAAMGHTVTATGGAFDSGFVFTNSGATFQHTFTSADAGMTFNYFCRTHATCCGMRGAVMVGSSAPPPAPGY